ncbi:MAG: TonB-dependent receptor [Melioribacteraceae bacterium]|nr:TonB-dependent receptor [Melioribacteraceae bacterium]
MLRFLFLFLFSISMYYSQSNQNQDTLIYKLDQITITATRYSENIMEIPLAVSIIPKNELKLNRNIGIDELLKSVPGVLSQSRAGNQDVRIVIRGFGARGAGDRSNYATTRGIKILQNGIPETEPDGRTSFDLIDVSLAQNVEVIRSNASAIWGNASGGVINISTLPKDEFSYNKLEYASGNFGLSKFIAEKFIQDDFQKLSLSLSNLKFSGWRQHSTNYKTLFNINYLNDFKHSKLGFYINAVSNFFLVPGPLTLNQFNINSQQANSFYLSRDERRHNRLGRLAITYDYHIDNVNSFSSMIFVSPKYLQRSERGTFRDFNRYFVGGSFIYKNENNFSDRFKNFLLAGFDEAYQDGAILFYSLSPTNGRGNQLRDNKREGANSFGAFVQNEIIYDNKFSAITGLRYDIVSYYSENYLNQNLGLQEKVFRKLTPKLGFTYRLNPTFSIYTNFGGGVEVPAGNETDPSSTFGEDKVYLINPLLEPIKSTTFEIGVKKFIYYENSDLIKLINYELSLYTINVENDIVPYRGGRFYFTAAKTRRNGLELSFNLKSKFNFDIFSSFTYSSNKYVDYTVDSIHYNKPNKFANYSGNFVAGIPNLFYNVGLNYSLNSFYGFYSTITLQTVSEYFVDDANKIKVPDFSIVNFSIGFNQLSVAGIKIYTSFSINNLFNKKYVASAFINPDVINNEPYYIEPGLPINYSFNLSFQF